MATLRQLQETLSQTSGAQFLYQPVIDRALFESTRKFTATRTLFPRRTWNTPQYLFNKRNNYPAARAVVEAPPTSGTGSSQPTSSVYAQIGYPVKHWQTNMDLAKFSIQVARVNGDLVQLELEGASENACWFEEAVNFYGSAGATNNTFRPTWDGADLLMAATSKFQVNGTPSIAMLDNCIDIAKKSYGNRLAAKDWAFVMSSEMLSSMGRLFVQLERYMGKEVLYPRDDRGQLGGQITDNRTYIDGGLEVATYRGIPLTESSFITTLGTMTSVTATPSGSDGTISAGTYWYAVEAVSDYGVTLASEASATVSSTNHVALSWTTPTITDVQGNSRQILFYRVFRTATNGAQGTETLYAVVAAMDTSDNAVTSFTDTGAIINPLASGSTAIAVTIASSGSNATPDGVTTPRLNPGGHTQQDIWLFPRDPDILCVPVVNEMQTTQLALVNARTQQLALTGDQVLAVRGPGFMAKACSVYVA